MFITDFFFISVFVLAFFYEKLENNYLKIAQHSSVFFQKEKLKLLGFLLDFKLKEFKNVALRLMLNYKIF